MAKEPPQDRKYTRDHEWAWQQKEGIALIGITDYAQEQLTDIVFVELPERGAQVERGRAAGRRGVREICIHCLCPCEWEGGGHKRCLGR